MRQPKGDKKCCGCGKTFTMKTSKEGELDDYVEVRPGDGIYMKIKDLICLESDGTPYIALNCDQEIIRDTFYPIPNMLARIPLAEGIRTVQTYKK